MKKQLQIALIGNPNVGKTSVFNLLTGLNHHVGNYPGVTVEKKTGTFSLNENLTAKITDLPGVYSINASSKDEEIALQPLLDINHKNKPEVVVVVAEVENLKRNLLLFTQIKDLGFKTLLVINMADRMKGKGISIDTEVLERELQTKIVLLSVRKKTGIENLKNALINFNELKTSVFFDITTVDKNLFNEIEDKNHPEKTYQNWIQLSLNQPTLEEKNNNQLLKNLKKIQHKETFKRYQLLESILKKGYEKNREKATDLSFRLDRLFTHKILGYLIFFTLMLFMFQAIFDWASIPMDFIDEQFANLSTYVYTNLPQGKLTELLSQGIIPGIGGVVVFIPQIAILFLFISLLEESGYMSRVVFLMDKLMRPFGLNGKSVVPMISGVACAIPAIMSARNIENTKERLVTMLITPFTTCSARIPIYVIIISLVIPNQKVFGFIGLQGLVMTLLYFSGFTVALLAAWILKHLIKQDRKTFFIIEMPSYKIPLFKNIFYTVTDKTQSFVLGAGKIILALSVILWFLGSHGPFDNFDKAEATVRLKFENQNISSQQLTDEIAGEQLRNSYIGIIGTSIEPIFRPLGYDWKISIAVLTSFAAREVFVGNLATLYNIGSDSEEQSGLLQKMKNEKHPDKTPVFTLASGSSLLVFYAFAMQCISTLAITRKETNSWKWMFVQFIIMSGIAYLLALLTYQILK